MPNFKTKTDPELLVEWKTGDINVVSISGENRKLLYEGDDAAFAKEVYDGVVKHYGDREKARSDNPTRADEAERAVEYRKPKKGGAPSPSR